jgi:hypothetical protein
MSTSGSGATWLSLLGEKKHDIKESLGQDYSVPGDISSGRSFRHEFEIFCTKKEEHKYSRLEAKLLPSYSPITELARAVDRSAADLQDLPAKDTLEGLIWWMSFALIEVNDPTRRPYMADPSIVRVQSWNSSWSSCNSDG